MKVGIFSGNIPSTTFIERLILGLAKSEIQVFIFGKIKKSVSYRQKTLSVIGYYDNLFVRYNLFWFYLKYIILLSIFKPDQKSKLQIILRKQSSISIWEKSIYYSILWVSPEILHIQWAKDIPNFLWVKEFGIKLVLSLRGAHINYSPITIEGLAEVYRNAFPKVDAFHGVSKAICKEAAKYDADLEKCKVVYSGLNLNYYKFLDEKYQNSFNYKEYLNILSIGRNHWIKGYDFAIDALSKIKKLSSFDFRYTIIGVNNSEELVFQRNQLGLQSEVIFLESMSSENVKKAIEEADVILVSSYQEGIPNVLLEAMALGTLVISSDCGGISEVIDDGVTGLIFKNRSKDDLIRVLNLAYGLKSTEIKKIVKEARSKIVQQHSENEMIRGMIQLYKDVVKD